MQTWWITPAPAGQATMAAASPTPVAATTASTGTGGELTITAQDSTFKPETLNTSAGAVTITLDNKDGGVIHNLHVFQGADATGASVGQTDLKAGPAQETLDLNLATGPYFYRCDAHPTTMKGTLTVS